MRYIYIRLGSILNTDHTGASRAGDGGAPRRRIEGNKR